MTARGGVPFKPCDHGAGGEIIWEFISAHDMSTGKVVSNVLEIRMRCIACKLAFRQLDAVPGFSLKRTMTSEDGSVIRIPLEIAPDARVWSKEEDDAAAIQREREVVIP